MEMCSLERVGRSPGERLLLCARRHVVETSVISRANDVRRGRLTSHRGDDIIVHRDRRDRMRLLDKHISLYYCNSRILLYLGYLYIIILYRVVCAHSHRRKRYHGGREAI